MRLKRVDVHDNCVVYTPSHEKYITYQNVSTTKFVSGYLDMNYETFSPVHVDCSETALHNPVLSRVREEGTDTALVILAKTAAYDTYHHCDICRFYREGIANTSTKIYSYQIQGFGADKQVIDLKIAIPPIHMKYFIVNESTLLSLILPQCNESASENCQVQVKTPIFMRSASSGDEGEDYNLLNV